jgi:hypothetical protein
VVRVRLVKAELNAEKLNSLPSITAAMIWKKGGSFNPPFSLTALKVRVQKGFVPFDRGQMSFSSLDGVCTPTSLQRTKRFDGCQRIRKRLLFISEKSGCNARSINKAEWNKFSGILFRCCADGGEITILPAADE